MRETPHGFIHEHSPAGVDEIAESMVRVVVQEEEEKEGGGARTPQLQLSTPTVRTTHMGSTWGSALPTGKADATRKHGVPKACGKGRGASEGRAGVRKDGKLPPLRPQQPPAPHTHQGLFSRFQPRQ
jgi:hypothetical protein